MIKTHKAYIIVNEQEIGKDVVAHVYYLENDDKRYTDYYQCDNPQSASRLLEKLSEGGN